MGRHTNYGFPSGRKTDDHELTDFLQQPEERDLFGLTERNWQWIVGVLAVAFVLMFALGFVPRV